MAEATFLHEGRVLDYTPAVAVSAGEVLDLGQGLIGIPSKDIAANALGSVNIAGVFRVTKNTGEIFAMGEEVYWDAGNSYAERAASGNTAIGRAARAAVSADTTVDVVLNMPGMLAAQPSPSASPSASPSP